MDTYFKKHNWYMLPAPLFYKKIVIFQLDHNTQISSFQNRMYS